MLFLHFATGVHSRSILISQSEPTKLEFAGIYQCFRVASFEKLMALKIPFYFVVHGKNAFWAEWDLWVQYLE